jgi:alkylmercury lyase
MAPPEDESAAPAARGGPAPLDALADFLRDNRLFHQAGARGQRVQLALYRLIAEGDPVALGRLAAAAGLGRGEVGAILGALPASSFQRDEAERILGFRGLGQVPSRHRLSFAGRALYAWCAFDCLFLPALLGGPVEVASTCPVTGTGIRLSVTPRGVAALTPETTVMTFVMPEIAAMRADLRGSFCCHVNFFASEQAAQAWRAKNRDAAIVSLDEGFELGRIRNQTSFGDIL